MVVLVAQLVLLLSLSLSSLGQDCSRFRQESCQGRDSVLAVERGVKSPLQCQASCFSRNKCKIFSFYPGQSVCRLYRDCRRRLSCPDCLSGPLSPRVSQCPRVARLTQQACLVCSLQPNTSSSEPDQDYGGSGDEYSDYSEPPTDYDDYSDDSDQGPGQDDVNIDDGLLDDVFEDEVNPRNNNNRNSNNRNNNNNNGGGGCSSCEATVVCVMGGSNSQGAVSDVAAVEAGSQYSRTPRALYISPFSPAMTRGSGRTASFFSGGSLYSCTPGYSVPSFSPLTGRLTSTTVPGACYNYDFSQGRWGQRGGQMSDYRKSGSLVSVGSYLMALAGENEAGQPLTSVELFDPRRPGIGWKEVPKWRMRRGVRSGCSAVTRDPRQGPQVVVIGGQGQGRRVSRLVLSSNRWLPVAPMRQARLQHACTPVNLNGRPGVVVSGGAGGANSSVEFWDLKTNKWLDLPPLSRGRRSHSMTTIQGRLAVAGGVAMDSNRKPASRRGEEEILDDVEIFDGSRWRRASRGLDQPRSGANLVSIPVRSFRG